MDRPATPLYLYIKYILNIIIMPIIIIHNQNNKYYNIHIKNENYVLRNVTL